MSLGLHLQARDAKTAAPQHLQLIALQQKIAEQQQNLVSWQQAQLDIRSYSQKGFLPAYQVLHTTWFLQLQVLWNSLSKYDLSKSQSAQLEEKIQSLIAVLQHSKMLNTAQKQEVEQLQHYFSQVHTLQQRKKNKKASAHVQEVVNDTAIENDGLYNDQVHEDYEQLRQAARLKRKQNKQVHAESLMQQSLKKVYLSIAANIHPDREPDAQQKELKTALLQRANAAYEQQDLYVLLQIQLEIEQISARHKQAFTQEHMQLLQHVLIHQSQDLQQQIEQLITDLVWSDNAKIAIKKSQGKLDIQYLYGQIDADTAQLKQRIKIEKQRLLYMQQQHGLIMLIQQSIL